nr:hypothetical protein [uncultured Pseudogulbenkiania sp.]
MRGVFDAVADAQFEAGLSGCRVELQIEHDGRIAARPWPTTTVTR